MFCKAYCFFTWGWLYSVQNRLFHVYFLVFWFVYGCFSIYGWHLTFWKWYFHYQCLEAIVTYQIWYQKLGDVKYYLGLEVSRNAVGFFVSQQKFISDLLALAELTDCRSLVVPLDPHLKLYDSDKSGDLIQDPSVYRAWVGILLYLNTCRPDISFSVHLLSQFMHALRVKLMDAAVRVLRYLKCIKVMVCSFMQTIICNWNFLVIETEPVIPMIGDLWVHIVCFLAHHFLEVQETECYL